MCSSQVHSANTGIVKISTANPMRYGSGTLGTVLTGASNGTYVKTIAIKAEDSTTQGMVRFFIDDGVNIRLFKEIYIPARTPTSFVSTFKVTLFGGFCLSSTDLLKASTEQGELFCIIADAVDWTNCECPA